MGNDIFRLNYMNNAPLKVEKNVSILGCGWLGLPLAKFFINRSYRVKGSVPATEKFISLKKEGILPYQIYLNPTINDGFDKDFFNSEILVINFPPKRRDDIEEFHPRQFEALIQEIKSSHIKKVIFISSTSVYANTNGIVDEQNEKIPEKSSGKALRTVERMLKQELGFTTTIIRFGGLIGYDRKPGRFFAGKKQVKDGEAPVNLIHQDDCIGIINHVIENELWGETYNACSPEHPKRKEFYEVAAKLGDYAIPQFSETKNAFKIINSDKLIKTGYEFQFKNPIEALKF